MVTAWDVPKNPLTDPTLDDSKLSKDIRWGFQHFHEHAWRSEAVCARPRVVQQLPSERRAA